MNQAFLEYFRCSPTFANFALDEPGRVNELPGFFTFGHGLTLFGKSVLAHHDTVDADLPDAIPHVRIEGRTCILPFDPTEVAANLRHENYVKPAPRSLRKKLIRKLYYTVRPLLSTRVRRHLQRASLRGWEHTSFPHWPVDRTVDRMFVRLMGIALRAVPDGEIPFIWFWPEGHSAAAIMTHDVETSAGLAFIHELMSLDSSFHISSSFQLIPDARYTVTPETLASIRAAGFEVNVHDLHHDGHLFDNHTAFREAIRRINNFAFRFDSRGFRAGALYRNQAWIQELRVSYDMSVPNVAHLDPQPGGCCTVMPYFLGRLLELPVTATQDYTLFHILQTHSQEIWLQQIAVVLEQHGMLNFIVHPDYLDNPNAIASYTALLAELSRLRAQAGLWIALPHEVDTWWRQRNAMTIVRQGSGWKIEGEGSERARVACATLHNGRLNYHFPSPTVHGRPFQTPIVQAAP